jgi:hypothetical protein
MNDSALSFRRWAVILAAGLSGVIVLISIVVEPGRPPNIPRFSRHMQLTIER